MIIFLLGHEDTYYCGLEENMASRYETKVEIMVSIFFSFCCKNNVLISLFKVVAMSLILYPLMSRLIELRLASASTLPHAIALSFFLRVKGYLY